MSCYPVFWPIDLLGIRWYWHFWDTFWFSQVFEKFCGQTGLLDLMELSSMEVVLSGLMVIEGISIKSKTICGVLCLANSQMHI